MHAYSYINGVGCILGLLDSHSELPCMYYSMYGTGKIALVRSTLARVSIDLSLIVPAIQLRVTNSSIVLPSVKASKYGIL